jgi:diacylglycerol kinase family enzyme
MSDSVELRRLLFVMNPISGDIDKAAIHEQIRVLCDERGMYAELFKTTGEDDLTRLRQHIQAHRFDAVFAAGGDGTVSLVAQALVHGTIPMGIVPLGSGNGLSKDLGIPQAPDAALLLVDSHKVQALDTLEVGGHFSAHLADLGFNALIVERFSQGDTRGPIAYARIALQEYMSYEPVRYRIETDAENWEGEAFMLTIANARTFGSNMVINPGSPMDDGRFELCLIEPFPGAAAPGVLYHLYTEGFEDSEYMRRLTCTRAVIHVPGHAEVQVQVDGEPLLLPTPLQVTIHPRSLRVLVPVLEEEQ